MTHTAPNFVLLFGLGALCALIANSLMFVTIGRVNRKLPHGQKISYLRWGMKNVTQQYNRLYPQGKLIFVVYACGTLMAIFLVASFIVRR
jgi:hypothetical protein